MPKRSFPDDTPISPQQLKTRVGEKEVNEGVNKEANMKVVYDKTLNMMMEGAKNYTDEGEKGKTETENITEEDPEILPGQTYLSPTGEIAGVYEEVKEPNGVPQDGEKEKGEAKGDSGETGEVGDGDGPGQQTTLADFGFDLCGHKHSPTSSPSKEPTKPAEDDDGPGQKTTLADFGFDLSGYKSSPTSSPSKEPVKTPVKVHKVPFTD